jgi:hypothetical protein
MNEPYETGSDEQLILARWQRVFEKLGPVIVQCNEKRRNYEKSHPAEI